MGSRAAEGEANSRNDDDGGRTAMVRPPPS